MLNGKFYTGLPPQMIERGGASQNHQKSHIFWPDETQLDSPVEKRFKRRASFHLPLSEKPNLQTQLSLEEPEVDTKQMFQNEFTKSSIEFYDVIQEEDELSPYKRVHSVKVGKPMKKGLTLKPTATTQELPESVIDEEYTTAKKKEAYHSNILFNDYIDEKDDWCFRYNTRGPKMDRNNKRDVELNTKNSPKLSVKRDLTNFSSGNEERRNNDEISEQLQDSNEDYNNNKMSAKIIENVMDNNEDERRREYSSSENLTKKYSRNDSKPGRNHIETDEYFTDMDHLENRMGNMRVRTSPSRQLHYRNERYENERYPRMGKRYVNDYRSEADERYCYDDIDNVPSVSNAASATQYGRMSPPYLKTRSQHKQRQQFRMCAPEFAPANDARIQNMETNLNRAKKSLNIHSNNNNIINNNNNNNHNYKHNNNKFNNNQPQKERKILPNPSIVETSTTTPTDNQKHLRSNLCFSNGEIVGATNKTPTPNNIRSARSSATRRVSVGLPV